MEIPSDLAVLFAGSIHEQNSEYHVSVPKQQIDNGALDADKQYRIALIETDQSASSQQSSQQSSKQSSRRSEHRSSQGNSPPPSSQSRAKGNRQFASDGNPPVEEGDQITVEIESTGDKGDGIAKVEGGYVIVVENGEVGEELTVRIDAVKPNYAFADVVSSSTDSSPVSA